MTDDDTTTHELLGDRLQRIGVTYRQLDYWTTLGHVQAIAEQNPGSGAHRQYEDHELDIAAMMGRLRDAEIPVAVAARLARHHVTERRDFPDERPCTSMWIAPGIEVVMWDEGVLGV